ncbi:hypothetical protein KBZ19_00250 [Synechococcus sp. L2F]|uniref:hypothetical protein n=1 Tax=Synechococcus sp. L2F TaxID=2823739 RepID=UPI0020CBED08|nr:hypothetical protein [Synechococcus sp. L2F]MCP9826922.1 hypothetical protein [Synechococcus sp. L2F]
MKTSFIGSETGSVLFADGAQEKYQLFSPSYIKQDAESLVDPAQLQFDVAPEDFFSNAPRLVVSYDISVLNKLLAQNSGCIDMAIILKEQLSRRATCIHEQTIDSSSLETGNLEIDFVEDHFGAFSLTGDVYVDIVATVADEAWVKRLIGFKRFNLMFGIGKGLFTPIPKPPDFFEQNGAGKDTLWLVSLVATGPSSFTDIMASDIIQVFINEDSAVKFGRLCNAGVAGDLLARLFVVDVVSEAVSALFSFCTDLPTEVISGSICSKLLTRMGLDKPEDYMEFRNRWINNPSIVRARVQDMCTLSSTARTTTR